MRTIVTIVVLLFALLLVVFSKAVMAEAVKAFELFIGSVFPALFPFLTCTLILQKADIFTQMRGSRLIRTAIVFLISAVSGCPTGTLLVDSTFKDDLSPGCRSGLCAAMSLSSPMFIFGTIANRFLPVAGLGWLISVSHYGAAFIISLFLILTESIKRRECSCVGYHGSGSVPGPLQLMHAAIPDAVQIMLNVGGMIVFFAVIICVINSLGILERINSLCRGIVFGTLEMTNGISYISQISVSLSVKCCAIAGILSFGGICVLMQAKSTGIAIGTVPYICAKIVQSILAMLICYILFPLFIDSSAAVFKSFDTAPAIERSVSALEISACVIVSICVSMLTAAIVSKKSGI